MPKPPRKISHPPKAFSPARIAALTALESVLTDGKTLLDTLPLLENQCRDMRDLALARDIASGTCRWWGRIRHVLLSVAPRLEKFPATVQRILEMSVYQILYLDRVPEYAVLSDAVELTRDRRFAGLTSAVNGILRAITRNRGEVPFPDAKKEYAAYLAAFHSHPQWLVEQWLKIWSPEKVESLCQFNNTIAPLSLRVRVEREGALAKLEALNLAPQVDTRFPDRIILDSNAGSVSNLFDTADWVAQDGAAMLIAPLVNPQPHWRIWDACAAPGGKTVHMADLSQNQAYILASDHSAERLRKVSDQIAKLKWEQVTVQQLDALRDRPPLEGEGFDAILVDAPCSGWGTFRRHPDLRWRLQPMDARKFGQQALRILENVQQYVKPGGMMVYGTCTLSPEENEQTVMAFLERHPNFTLEPVKPVLLSAFQEAQTQEGFLRVLPPVWNMDGAFAARLRRRH